LWFLIILLPTSSILPIKDVFVEHRLYLPSLGVFFIFASGMIILLERLKKKTFYLAFISLFIIVCTLFGATHNRNRIWNSRLAMWEDAVMKSPRSARAWHNLGNCYLLKKDYRKALEAQLKAWDLAAPAIELYYDIGLSLENLGMKSLAKDFFIPFVKYAPADYDREKKAMAFKYDITGDTALPDRNIKALAEIELNKPEGMKDQ
jgi:tetratricopeptide (TPR) repeat protein